MVVTVPSQPSTEGGRGSVLDDQGKNAQVMASESSDDGDVDDDSSSDETFQDTNSEDHKATEVKEVQKLSRWETLGIRFWRIVVLMLLVIAGILVSTGTYLFLRDAEQVDYVNRYFLFTGTIGDASQFHITNMQQAIRSLGETITSAAWAINATFPYVTPPVFEVHAYHARVKSGLESIIYHPLILTLNDIPAWNNYSWENRGWYDDSKETVLSSALENGTQFVNGTISPIVWTTVSYENPIPVPVSGPGPFFPIWMMSPPPSIPEFINLDNTKIGDFFPIISLTREGVFSDVEDLSSLANLASTPEVHVQEHLQYESNITAENVWKRPHSVLVAPVFDEVNDPEASVVGVTGSIVSWDRYLTNLLPTGVNGLVCVLKNSCGQAYSYVLNGNEATFMGEGDFHDPRFNDTEVSINLYDYLHPNRTSKVRGHCEYKLFVYASAEYQTSTESNTPVIFTSIVAVTFSLVVVTFIVYDIFVQRRNSKVEDAAVRSNVILSSLFPTTIRDRLINGKEDDTKPGKGPSGTKTRLRSFLDSDTPGGLDAAVGGGLGYEGKPIADLFPETTIMFMDIAGFTAWSSVREPAQVFTLLETLYRAFDEIAKRRRVFKVETVGDCYVAVTGLPDPRKDHAVAMARFARDCMQRARALTKKLEVTLGPDTGDLTMRAGLHSGPVTAGVLRGERSRFQLFGDTMNTASRMESTGKPGRIQISNDTAELLMAAGKSAWISLRDEKVVAKGKGEMQTYWLSPGEQRSDTSSNRETGSTHSGSNESDQVELDGELPVGGQSEAKTLSVTAGKQKRLIEWNVDVLLRLLKQIVASRRARGVSEYGSTCVEGKVQFAEPGKTVIDEVKEIISLPKFNAKAAAKQENPDSIILPPEVVEQMYDYVSNIASIYNDSNPFHNFEHASHVTMSVVKLLSRIVAPADVEYDENMAKQGKTLHDHTYGITSDPLTQFACVFSALIHDADHSGAPNMQLVKEKTFIAEFYKGQSVAEQNSVDLSWQLLMDSAYDDLRHTIYSNEAELKRFRQLVVNSVMATDIVDKELKTLRNERWTKAFSEDALKADESDDVRVNRKATIVIEHLIQASDVAHTMQHWHIYRKWNERFFVECYRAFKEGRAEKDPSEGWYQGELGFYDFYIIPLAKKLKDCGVFGVSSDEYLNYAIRNRKEWEERGREVVNEMVAHVANMRFDAPSKHRAGGI